MAASKGEEWAEPIDLGGAWNGGAPLPHLISNGFKAVLICYAHVVDPDWDGTYVTVVSPADSEPAALLEFTFKGCYSIKFGGPNDEVLHGHPLGGRGLEGYGPYIIHNSRWIAEEEAINSVHEAHQGGWHDTMNHYFFVFHDEMFEALARSVKVKHVHAVMSDRVLRAASSILGK